MLRSPSRLQKEKKELEALWAQILECKAALTVSGIEFPKARL
jgi:hypothetical protein